MVALIIDSLAENIFLKRGWFLFYLEGFMVGLGGFFVVVVGFCFFFFSHLPPFQFSPTKNTRFYPHSNCFPTVWKSQGNISKFCAAFLIKIVKPRWTSLWEIDMALCMVNALLMSLRASHITILWPTQLEWGLASSDGLLQQNPL